MTLKGREVPGRGRPGRDAGARARGMAALSALLHAVIGRWAFFAGAVVLALGAALLSAAWKVGPAWHLMVQEARSLGGRAEARVADTFLVLDVEGRRLKQGVHWTAHARMRLCVDLIYPFDLPSAGQSGKTPDAIAGVAARQVFCSEESAARPTERFGALDMREIVPGAAIDWPRDQQGNPLVALRMAPQLHAWLAAEPARYWPLLGKTEEAERTRPPAGSELDYLLLEFDRPLEWLLRAWPEPRRAVIDASHVIDGAGPSPGGRIALRFDPRQPERAYPEVFAERVDMTGERWASAAAFALFGLLVWRMGVEIAFIGSGRAVRAALLVVPLLALPWWSERLAGVARWMGGDAYYLGVDMAADLGIEGRVPFTRHSPQVFAETVRIAWQPLAPPSRYAGVLAPFDLAVPEPPPDDADAALAQLSSRIAEQVARLPDGEAEALFARLAALELAGEREIGWMFVAAARAAEKDAARTPAVRAQAGRFLWWFVVSPALPAATDPGFATRRALWSSLLDAEDPAVRNMARSALERFPD